MPLQLSQEDKSPFWAQGLAEHLSTLRAHTSPSTQSETT